MKPLASGTRRVPTHHITIRVPWHDSGWAGSVCAGSLKNTSCQILPRIREGKRDAVEVRCADKAKTAEAALERELNMKTPVEAYAS